MATPYFLNVATNLLNAFTHIVIKLFVFFFSTLRIINYLFYLNIKKILYLCNKKKLMKEIWRDIKDYEGL